MHFSRILVAGAATAAVVAATLLVCLENFGSSETAPGPLSKHGSALQRLADDGGDQGGDGTEDRTLQPSEQQEEQQEEQQQQGGGPHGHIRYR